jgi:hypothetical protein
MKPIDCSKTHDAHEHVNMEVNTYTCRDETHNNHAWMKTTQLAEDNISLDTYRNP